MAILDESSYKVSKVYSVGIQDAPVTMASVVTTKNVTITTPAGYKGEWINFNSTNASQSIAVPSVTIDMKDGPIIAFPKKHKINFKYIKPSETAITSLDYESQSNGSLLGKVFALKGLNNNGSDANRNITFEMRYRTNTNTTGGLVDSTIPFSFRIISNDASSNNPLDFKITITHTDLENGNQYVYNITFESRGKVFGGTFEILNGTLDFGTITRGYTGSVTAQEGLLISYKTSDTNQRLTLKIKDSASRTNVPMKLISDNTKQIPISTVTLDNENQYVPGTSAGTTTLRFLRGTINSVPANIDVGLYMGVINLEACLGTGAECPL